jgi:hypothetical protein
MTTSSGHRDKRRDARGSAKLTSQHVRICGCRARRRTLDGRGLKGECEEDLIFMTIAGRKGAADDARDDRAVWASVSRSAPRAMCPASQV